MGEPAENTIKCFPSPFLLLRLLTFFFLLFDGSGPDITGNSRVSLAQPEKAPADRRSRRGGVGHSRGRSYQGAAECEGQKSRCIQARRTVTRHSSAQGPSEPPALASHRLLFNSGSGFRGGEEQQLTFHVIFHRDANNMRGCRYL